MDWLAQPWPWYVAGPLIGLMVPLLLLLVGKSFGVSSSFRHLNAICSSRSSIEYLSASNWRAEAWNLFFVGGIFVGAFLAMGFLAGRVPFLPEHYYNSWGALKLFAGGLLVGFGTRYADGCTSGHSIMGLANLRWPSLVATLCFFAGGLLAVWVLKPLF
jgi:uncharacterized membrane protein YedE/YeeE